MTNIKMKFNIYKAITLLGGAGIITLGVVIQSGLFFALGVAVILTVLSKLNSQNMTGGWVGASALAPAAFLSLFSVYLLNHPDCANLSPGIFIISAVNSIIPGWVAGWLLGRKSGITQDFPFSFVIFLLFIGIALGLMSGFTGSCSLGKGTLLYILFYNYIICWSGLVFGVMKKK